MRATGLLDSSCAHHVREPGESAPDYVPEVVAGYRPCCGIIALESPGRRSEPFRTPASCAFSAASNCRMLVAGCRQFFDAGAKPKLLCDDAMRQGLDDAQRRLLQRATPTGQRHPFSEPPLDHPQNTRPQSRGCFHRSPRAQEQKGRAGWEISDSRLDALHEQARGNAAPFVRRAQGAGREVQQGRSRPLHLSNAIAVVGSAIELDFNCQKLGGWRWRSTEEGQNDALAKRRDKSLESVGIPGDADRGQRTFLEDIDAVLQRLTTVMA